MRISIYMRRLNPQTNAPFKRGDIRDDGLLFWSYKLNYLKKDGFFSEAWHTEETYNKKIKWAKDNKHLHNEWSKAYQQTEKGKLSVKRARLKHTGSPNHIARNGKRRAAKLLRTPKWLTQDDLFFIEEAYHLAKLRTELLGIPYHVDHILPLQGKTVSGLHVPANLQVIPATINLKKSNRHE